MQVLEREQVVQKLHAFLKTQAAVRFAYLYGSWALGYARPDSDVDIAAFFAKDSDTAPEWSLQEELTRRLGLRVEVINLNERPAAAFFAKVLPTALAVKDAPDRAQWEQEIGKMAKEEPGSLEDYLAFVLDAMSEKNAKLREALPLLDEVDLDQVKRGDLHVVQDFLGAFFMIFEPVEALARRMANYVHLTKGMSVPTDLKGQIHLLIEQIGIDLATAEPLNKLANVRNKLAHAYWNLTEEELATSDVRAARALLGDLSRRVDSFIATARKQNHNSA